MEDQTNFKMEYNDNDWNELKKKVDNDLQDRIDEEVRTVRFIEEQEGNVPGIISLFSGDNPTATELIEQVSDEEEVSDEDYIKEDEEEVSDEDYIKEDEEIIREEDIPIYLKGYEREQKEMRKEIDKVADEQISKIVWNNHKPEIIRNPLWGPTIEHARDYFTEEKKLMNARYGKVNEDKKGDVIWNHISKHLESIKENEEDYEEDYEEDALDDKCFRSHDYKPQIHKIIEDLKDEVKDLKDEVKDAESYIEVLEERDDRFKDEDKMEKYSMECIHITDNNPEGYIYPIDEDQELCLCPECNMILASKVLEQLALETFIK